MRPREGLPSCTTDWALQACNQWSPIRRVLLGPSEMTLHQQFQVKIKYYICYWMDVASSSPRGNCQNVDLLQRWCCISIFKYTVKHSICYYTCHFSRMPPYSYLQCRKSLFWRCTISNHAPEHHAGVQCQKLMHNVESCTPTSCWHALREADILQGVFRNAVNHPYLTLVLELRSKYITRLCNAWSAHCTLRSQHCMLPLRHWMLPWRHCLLPLRHCMLPLQRCKLP